MPARWDLVGVWRQVSLTSGGRTVHTTRSHVVFGERETWEVHPGRVVYQGDPHVEIAWDLEGGQLVEQMRWIDLDGRVTRELTRRLDVALVGDELRLRSEHGMVAVLRRERDPVVVERLSRRPVPVPPRTRTVADLGVLRCDANLNYWKGAVTLRERGVNLHVDGAEDEPDAPFERARTVVRALREGGLTEACRFAARALLDTKNSSWLREDEADVDADDFVERLTLETISVEDGGSTLYLDDGDLFWGHVILVRLDLRHRPVRAEIAG